MEKSFQVNCCSEGQVQLALVLPNPLVPSFRTGIIEVDYCVMVEIDKSKKLCVEFPVIIGTVPIGQMMSMMMRAPAYSVTQPEIAPPEYQDRVEVVMASAPPDYDDHL